jgi:hypothetical protein
MPNYRRVNVPEFGYVNFPAEMSEQEIVSAIESDILPQIDQAKADNPELARIFGGGGPGAFEPETGRPVGDVLQDREKGFVEKAGEALAYSLAEGPTAKLIGAAPKMDIPGIGKIDVGKAAASAPPLEEMALWQKKTAELSSLFTDPINQATLAFGGVLGRGAIAAGGGKILARATATRLGAKVGRERMGRMMVASAGGAGSFSLFDFMNEFATQKDAGHYDARQLAWSAGRGALMGGSLGGAAGIKNPIGSFIAEVGLFGTASPLLHGELPSREGYFDALVTVGALKTAHKISGATKATVAKVMRGETVGLPELRAAEADLTPEKIEAVAEEVRDTLEDATPKVEPLETAKALSDSEANVERKVFEQERSSKGTEELAGERGKLDFADEPIHVLQVLDEYLRREGAESRDVLEEIALNVEGKEWSQGIRDLSAMVQAEFGIDAWHGFLAEEGYIPTHVERSIKGQKPEKGGERPEPTVETPVREVSAEEYRAQSINGRVYRTERAAQQAFRFNEADWGGQLRVRELPDGKGFVLIPEEGAAGRVNYSPEEKKTATRARRREAKAEAKAERDAELGKKPPKSRKARRAKKVEEDLAGAEDAVSPVDGTPPTSRPRHRRRPDPEKKRPRRAKGPGGPMTEGPEVGREPEVGDISAPVPDVFPAEGGPGRSVPPPEKPQQTAYDVLGKPKPRTLPTAQEILDGAKVPEKPVEAPKAPEVPKDPPKPVEAAPEPPKSPEATPAPKPRSERRSKPKPKKERRAGAATGKSFDVQRVTESKRTGKSRVILPSETPERSAVSLATIREADGEYRVEVRGKEGSEIGGDKPGNLGPFKSWDAAIEGFSEYSGRGTGNIAVVEAPKPEAPKSRATRRGKPVKRVETKKPAPKKEIPPKPTGKYPTGVKKPPKGATGDLKTHTREGVEEQIGRKLNKDESTVLDSYIDGRDVYNLHDGEYGIDFFLAMKNSPVLPIKVRRAMSQAYISRTGGPDVPPPTTTPRSVTQKPNTVAARGSVSTDLSRPTMNHVYVTEKGDVVSTDGHRLMIVRGGEEAGEVRWLKPQKGGGFEDVTAKAVAEEWQFPAYENVIPKSAKKVGDLRDLSELKARVDEYLKANPGSGNLIVKFGDAYFKGKLFSEMLQQLQLAGVKEAEVRQKAPDQALHLVGKDSQAEYLLMPLRPPEEGKSSGEVIADFGKWRKKGESWDATPVKTGEGTDATPSGVAGKVYSFPGPIMDPDFYAEGKRHLGEMAEFAEGVGKAAKDEAAARVGAGSEYILYRLFGNEGFERPQHEPSPNPLKNSEEVLSQTAEGSRIYEASVDYKRDVNKYTEDWMERYKAVDEKIRGGGFLRSIPGSNARRKGAQRWQEVIEALDTGKAARPELQEYVTELRTMLDDMWSWARQNNIPIGYKENYLAHIFDGRYWLNVEGEPAQNFASMSEALYAMKTAKSEGKEATLRQQMFMPTFEGTLLSRNSYWKMAQELRRTLGDELEVLGKDVTIEEITGMLKGEKIARPKPRFRFFGNAMERLAENPNFSRDPKKIFELYIYGLSRKVAQDKYANDTQKLIESMPLKDYRLRQWVEETYLPQVLGHPTRFEMATANWFGRKIGGKHVEPLAVRRFFSTAAGIQFIWDLGYSPVSAAVNATQPYINTYPIVGERSILHGAKMATKAGGDAKLLHELRDAGVIEQVSPLTHRRIQHEKGRVIHRVLTDPLGMFSEVEWMNRATSYFSGKDYATRTLEKRGDVAGMEYLADRLAVSREAGEAGNTKLHRMAKTAANLKELSVEGKAHREKFIREFGRVLSDRTQFRVGRENLPSILNEAPTRLLIPYKSFMLNQLKYTWDTLKTHEYKGGPLLKQQSWRRAGVSKEPVKALRHAGMVFALAGTMGSPVLYGAFEAVNALYRALTGDDLKKELRDMGLERGLVGKLGVDISGNLALNMPQPGNLLETTLGRYGKIAYYLASFAPGGYDLTEQRRIGRNVDPSQVRRTKDASKIWATGRLESPIKGDLIDYTGDSAWDRGRAALRAQLGFQDPRIRRFHDRDVEMRKKVDKLKTKKSDVSERLATAIIANDEEVAVKVMESAVDELVKAVDRLTSTDNENTMMNAYTDYQFWYEIAELAGTSFPNAIERKLLPRGYRRIDLMPKYAREQARHELFKE